VRKAWGTAFGFPCLDLTQKRIVPAFLDEDFVPHDEQWSFLLSIRRTPGRLIKKISREFKPRTGQSEPSKSVGGPIKSVLAIKL